MRNQLLLLTVVSCMAISCQKRNFNPAQAMATDSNGAVPDGYVQIGNFQMGVAPVTQLIYFQVTGQKPSYFHDNRHSCPGDYDQTNDICPNNPVERVSWDDAQAFIQTLNLQHQRAGSDGASFRLPTNAEWVMAASGNTQTVFGDMIPSIKNYGWTYEISEGHTHPVKQLNPNTYGLYDIAGNVWEWTQEAGNVWSSTQDGLNIYNRLVRGCSCNIKADVCREAAREYAPIESVGDLGFRLVRIPR